VRRDRTPLHCIHRRMQRRVVEKIEVADLQLQAKENTITISGKKPVVYGDKVSIHRRERVAGNFDRTITVPVRIDPTGIKAELRDGILALFIPRAESDKPRAIKIG
jgi:HSP20 family protein